MVAASIAIATSGCVVTQGQRVPNMVAEAQEQAVEPAPVIKVVFGHKHKVHGKHYSEHDEGSAQVFKDSLLRVMAKSPILKNASASPTAPIHYLLLFDTAVDEDGLVNAYVSGATLFLVPLVLSPDLIVEGALYEAATANATGSYEARTSFQIFAWLPLLPFLPITLALAPGDELYDDTYEDVLIQLARDLSRRPLPPAVSADTVKIQEEWDGKRSITVEAEP